MIAQWRSIIWKRIFYCMRLFPAQLRLLIRPESIWHGSLCQNLGLWWISAEKQMLSNLRLAIREGISWKHRYIHSTLVDHIILMIVRNDIVLIDDNSVLFHRARRAYLILLMRTLNAHGFVEDWNNLLSGAHTINFDFSDFVKLTGVGLVAYNPNFLNNWRSDLASSHLLQFVLPLDLSLELLTLLSDLSIDCWLVERHWL